MSEIKVCFLSNYMTHHQLPLCLELERLTGGKFKFIETASLPDERKNFGYEEIGKRCSFVIRAYECDSEKDKVIDCINTSDIVIIGSAPDKYIRQRIKNNGMTFRYSERIFKNREHDILRQIKYILKTYPYKKKKLYYLFSSGYAAVDYKRCGADESKMLKWGYFPETIEYESINDVVINKTPNSIIWVGRFIEWKHPEIPVRIAKRLNEEGICFRMQLIGSGPLEKKIEEQIKCEGLENCVHLLGSMKPQLVREYMKQNEIFLFTSDRNEGWGAVLNEAMNSGCATIASHAIGAVPFLINHGENGYIYQDGDFDDLYHKVKTLLTKRDLCYHLAVQGYETIVKTWNAKVAAERLVDLFKGNGLVEEGPCSQAQIMEDDWFKERGNV